MLTISQLKEMPPHTIFAEGAAMDNPFGIHATGSGKLLRWVAIRGDIHDWAIYYHWFEKNSEWVARHGDKLHNEEIIKRLVPCDEAYRFYRH